MNKMKALYLAIPILLASSVQAQDGAKTNINTVFSEHGHQTSINALLDTPVEAYAGAGFQSYDGDTDPQVHAGLQYPIELGEDLFLTPYIQAMGNQGFNEDEHSLNNASVGVRLSRSLSDKALFGLECRVTDYHADELPTTVSAGLSLSFR